MRSRSMSFYSMEDYEAQMKHQHQETIIKHKEHDGLSSHSTNTSLQSLKYLNSESRLSEEDSTEEQESQNVIKANMIYESDLNMLESELKESESKIVCQCIKNCILSGNDIFSNSQRQRLKRSITMNSLKEMKINKYIYLMTKQYQPKTLAEKCNYHQNFFYQNIEGDKRLKMLIASNSIEEKNKFIAQLLFNDNDNRFEKYKEEEYDDYDDADDANPYYDDNEENDDDGLCANPKKYTKSLLNIIEKKMFYNNKVIDIKILDTDIDFHNQLISTAYYKIPKLFLGIIDNEKVNQPLSFIEMLNRKYIKHASKDQKLIIIDINYSLGSKCIEQYCTKQGLTYILLDKDYSLLPISLINYLLLYSHPKQRTEDKNDWDNIDCIKNGFEYNVEEAFIEPTSTKCIKRPMSLTNMKIYSRF